MRICMHMCVRVLPGVYCEVCDVSVCMKERDWGEEYIYNYFYIWYTFIYYYLTRILSLLCPLFQLRKHIVEELLNTERDYVRDLQAVVVGYQAKLAQPGLVDGLRPEDSTLLFGWDWWMM